MSKTLRKMLKQSYSVISKSILNADVNPWVKDNFPVIHKYYKLALANKNALKFTDYYKTLHTYCRRCDYLPDAKSLVNYLNSQNKHYKYLELASTKDVLAINAINLISKGILDKNQSVILPNGVKLLISLSNPQFDEITENVWASEKYIAKYESEYYRFDSRTKEQYRKYISDYARKNGISETDAAKNLVAEAKRKSIPLGTLIYVPPRKYKTAWWILSALLFFMLSAFAVNKLGVIYLLLIIPIGAASFDLADKIVSLKCPITSAPRLDLEAVPKNAKTLVAVAALMNGDKNDNKIFDSLEKFACMNPDKNIYFCLLADFPDSGEQYHVNDNDIVLSAQKKIDELNRLHGQRFCLFFRERVLNKSEERFGGWERKRGAVCELVSHIVNGDKNEYYGGEFIREIKYLLTLDSDTNLSVGSVKELVSVALHPVNQPIIKNGRVVSGYGIIQPSVRTELESAYKSGFSRLVSGVGGADAYATAGFQRLQTLFGSGIFCGKGLINVNLFQSYVNGKIPEGLVLSHDSIEGSILRTLSLSDVTLTDSTPSNTVSFFRRQHRWMRGDFQNLYFLKGGLLDLKSKGRLLITVLHHLLPVCSFFALVYGAFIEDIPSFWLYVFAFANLFLPCVFSVFNFLFFGSPFAVIRFFSKAYTDITQTAVRILFEISACARKAFLTLHAYSLAIIRMINRKKTLEWTTAAQTELLSSSLGKYVLDSAFSALAGLLLLVFAIPPFVRFGGLMFFVYPLVSAILSRRLDGGAVTKPKLSQHQKDVLIVHAKDMFGFYMENMGEKTNYLPPDNVQFSPVKSIAMRTSPTNIGFYMVSLLAARDMGMIDSKTLYTNLNSTVTTIEKLEKYEGNLYNWYDISNLSVIGDRFVSLVDSGNFLVMLTALKEGLFDYSDEEPALREIISRLKNLIDDTRLDVMYDQKRHLFKIGINPQDDNSNIGYYDLLMSEARMTAYYSVAKSIVPKKHWQKLGRGITHKLGYMGMLSWSGTAFEYLMPQLFLPLYSDSFMYESIAFSLMVQRLENSVWGVSESGYYSFDSDMNYQYKANGIQGLALRRISQGEKIISPYSTYLSLCILGNSAIKNLKALESKGMYGKYGLYEALDMNENTGGLIVKSYMAHHVGMSIIGVMNAVFDNLFVRRFMSDKQMGSANELLQEKIPVNAQIVDSDLLNRWDVKKNVRFINPTTESVNLNEPQIALLSRGDMTALISGSGHISLNSGEKALVNSFFDKKSLRFSPSVVFVRGNKVYGCAPLYGKDEKYSFERGDSYAAHIASGKDFSARVKYSISKNTNCFIINTRGESLRKYDVILSFEPVLDTFKNYRAHIAFSRLFLESEYDKTKRILYFHRRSRNDGSHVFTLAVAPREKDMNFEFAAGYENSNLLQICSPTDYAFCNTDNHASACIDPICIIRSKDADGGKATFLITCGETKAECEQNIRIARGDKSEYALPEHNEMTNKLLPLLLYGRGVDCCYEFVNSSINQLWAKSISGDFPLITVYMPLVCITETEALLKSFLLLSNSSIRTELIFVVKDDDKYNRPIENSVLECCKRLGCIGYLGRKGGIFVLREREIQIELFHVLKNSSHVFLDFSGAWENKTLTEEVIPIVTKPENILPLIIPEDALSSHNGYFTHDGFVVDKNGKFPNPYSYVLTGYRFSTILTQNSLGYTFFDNARERRVCSFLGDKTSLENGERLFCIKNNVKYDLCAVAHKVSYEKGRAVYYGNICDTQYEIIVTVSPRFPIKLIKIKASQPMKVNFELKPVMGDSALPVNGIQILTERQKGNSCLLFKNPLSLTFPEGVGFAGIRNGTAVGEKCTLENESTQMLFFVGACTTQKGARNICSRVSEEFFEQELFKARDFANSFAPDMKFSTKSKSTDMLLNHFLPYQIAACRFYARGSFYQSGGAYGFRDQLQDCLALVYSNPKAVRTHIIRCCAHQYEDGTVMHWWHTRNYNGVNRGIKSKCSDDLLYLPIVVADYLEKTGDYSVLDVPVYYLSSPPLGSASERYEQPQRSSVRESVYKHCLQVFKGALKKGKNGLVLMGSCDWNDAFSLVGEKGIGESVFSTFLYVISAKKFIPVCEYKGDKDISKQLQHEIEILQNDVQKNAFYGDRYARAICDDGTVLGIESSEECKIDILSQAFAAIAGMDNKNCKITLKNAFTKLYDRENRIFKLFYPPFSKGNARVGYIRGYVPGIRENGGQYTHGALWGALGCIVSGMYEEALQILDCINPATRVKDKKLAEKYKNEPYVISADIYSGEFSGMGGWSWYTGAAAWFYKIMLEYVLGIKIGANQTILSATPIIPFKSEFIFGEVKLKITASEKVEQSACDGNPISFPHRFQKGEYDILLPVYKSK